MVMSVCWWDHLDWSEDGVGGTTWSGVRMVLLRPLGLDHLLLFVSFGLDSHCTGNVECVYICIRK